MKKKRGTKKTSYSHGGHHDTYFLIIVAGGFLVIVMAAFFMGNPLSLLTSPTPTPQVEAVTDKIAENTVLIKDFAFGPSELTVKAGTTVTFVNNDTVSHTATADDGSFDTGLLGQGESATVTFNNTGTYTYYCQPHPSMRGTIIVE